jgi:hypothetical protein
VLSVLKKSQEWKNLLDSYSALFTYPEPFLKAVKDFTGSYATYSSNLISEGGTYPESEQRKNFHHRFPDADRIMAILLPRKQLHEFLGEATFLIDKALQSELARCIGKLAYCLETDPIRGLVARDKSVIARDRPAVAQLA